MGLDTVEFVIEIEQEFGIEISDEDAEKLAIVGDIARYVVAQCKYQTKIELTFENALNRVIEILVSSYAIPRRNINSTSHVVEDLGLN